MIINDLKNSFKQGNLLSRLIYINLGVFVLIKILGVFFFLFNLSSYEIIDLLALPAESKKLLSKPWTIITYMFVHNGFIHLIFNLLWLYFGGAIFLKYLNNKQIVSTYILGGLTEVCFMLSPLIIFLFLSQYLRIYCCRFIGICLSYTYCYRYLCTELYCKPHFYR